MLCFIKLKTFKSTLPKVFDLQKLKKCARNGLLDNVWFSDQANFLSSGHVNSKSNIF